jgi:hypothetical protein
MLCNKNELLESRNFVDGKDFTRDDPCIFVVYPPGAAGDLLISIIDKHYLRTGCEYYGIDNNGRVHIFTTDYESMDLHRHYEFNNQWFYDLATNLGNRNLNYSLLDQVIFGCHMYQESQVQYILDTFPHAKIISIMPTDQTGFKLIKWLSAYKLKNTAQPVPDISTVKKFAPSEITHQRVFNLPFGSLFNEESYYKQYDSIIKFLNLNGRLICFDYIKYYLSMQNQLIQSALVNYSKTL